MKYLFIPIELENLLFAFQEQWLGTGGYMITTGIYQNSEIQPNEELSTIKMQNGNLIPYGINTKVYELEIKKDLIGFCVEARPEQIPQELPQEIKIFNTAEEFLEYINKN